jgi:hypothetical protein
MERGDARMNEYVIRRGYINIPNNIKIKWWQLILYFPIILNLLYSRRYFIELINEKGEIRRIYEK